MFIDLGYAQTDLNIKKTDIVFYNAHTNAICLRMSKPTMKASLSHISRKEILPKKTKYIFLYVYLS